MMKRLGFCDRLFTVCVLSIVALTFGVRLGFGQDSPQHPMKELPKLGESSVLRVIEENPAHQNVQWRVKWRLHKFNSDASLKAGKPDEVIHGEGNILTTVGANILWQKLTGGSGTVYSNANAYLGVGDGTSGTTVPTVAAGDTDLAAPSNILLKAMDATYPSITTNAVTFSATFATSDANFHWREWGVFNGSNHATATMLNHRGVDLGTKVNTATWQFQVTLTLS